VTPAPAVLIRRCSYPRLGAFFAFHLLAFGAIWTGVTPAALALCGAVFTFQVLAVTVGYHRYFSHRAFEAGRVTQLLLAVWAQTSLQKGTLWWVGHHRYHHRHSDEECDLHSPKHGLWWSYAGWIFDEGSRATRLEEVPDLVKYPELLLLERFPYLPGLLVAVPCLLLAGAPGLVVGFVWGTILSHHATFANNCFAHVFGTRRFETKDLSRNNWFLAVITFGEGWHNNHHKYPGSARHGFAWWEVDLTFYVLLALEKLGLVSNLHAPPSSARPSKSRLLIEGLLAEAGVRVGGSEPWDVQVSDERFFDRALAEGTVGVGESYADGWWDCAALDQFAERAMRQRLKQRTPRRVLAQLALLRLRFLNRQSHADHRVASAHYDLGNALFERMLGPTMTYSCGYWARAQNLDEAQDHKHDLICDKLGLLPQHRLLDLGCGWGRLLSHAHRRSGCSGFGVTISEPQRKYAADAADGLPIEVALADFRDPLIDARGPFDRVVSVGMFEHLGRANQRVFFERAAELLTDDGLLLVQTIGNHARSGADPWIDRHIFPDSVVPCPKDITSAIGDRFVLEDWHSFGHDYAKTLMEWARNFDGCATDAALGLDPRFQRTWRYYLHTFAGAFRAGNSLQLWQLVLSKRGTRGGYRSVR
jgi:cyclopropane-fatty-acyl-phospholipid synthase